MGVFRDVSFCPFYVSCLHGKNCPRALTQLITNASKRLKIPVSVCKTEPACFEKQRNSDYIHVMEDKYAT